MTSKKELFAGPKIRKSTDPIDVFPTLPEPGETVISRPQQEQLHEKLLAINNGVEFKTDHDAEPLTKEQVEDEVLAAVDEAKDAAPEGYDNTPVPMTPQLMEWEIKNKKKALLSGLRKMDDKHNRTCGKCMKRLPIDQFRRYERSEVCEACED